MYDVYSNINSLAKKNRLKRLLVLLCLLTNTPFLGSQDSIKLDLITIKDHAFSFSSSLYGLSDTIRVSKSYYRDAGDFLDHHSPIYIRKYGPGLSYSLSVRGSNSAQVAVLWNGIRINSPMQGQSDISLIHFNPGNLVTFESNTYTHGLSGILSIKDLPLHEDGYSLKVANVLRSTYGNHLSGNASLKKGKWSSSVFLSLLRDLNRFDYHHLGEKKQIINNRINDDQIKVNVSFAPSKMHNIQFNAWAYQSERQIPPSFYEHSSDALQQDKSIRLLAAYQYLRSRFSMNISTGYLYDKLLYDSYEKNIHSDSYSQQLIQQADIAYNPTEDHQFQIEASNTFMKVHSSAYTNLQEIIETRLNIQYKSVLNKKHRIIGGIQVSKRDSENKYYWQPFLNYQYALSKSLTFHITGGNKTRYPGFNDLFWHQGGNDKLLPEKAFESEIGFSYSPLDWISFSNRNYLKRVENWILWEPVEHIFQASNIPDVMGYGMENSLKLSFQNRNMLYEGSLNQQLTQMQYASGANEGKQLIYTPRNLFKHSHSFNFKSWTISTDQQFTGKSYTRSDHSGHLDAYYLVNLTVEKEWNFSKFDLSSWFSIKNTFNTSYFSIENYAMPGRIFELGFQFKNKHLNKNTSSKN